MRDENVVSSLGNIRGVLYPSVSNFGQARQFGVLNLTKFVLLFGHHHFTSTNANSYLVVLLQHKLFATLMREIADEGNAEANRQMACIIAKNLIQIR